MKTPIKILAQHRAEYIFQPQTTDQSFNQGRIAGFDEAVGVVKRNQVVGRSFKIPSFIAGELDEKMMDFEHGGLEVIFGLYAIDWSENFVEWANETEDSHAKIITYLNPHTQQFVDIEYDD